MEDPPSWQRRELSALRSAYRELSTERLILRRPEAGDAQQVFEAFASDPEVTRFLKWRPHRTLSDAHRAMAARLERMAAGEEYSWLLALRADASILGIISAWSREGEVEIGFALGRQFWGRGLMTEAARAVVAWALEPAHVTRIWATCDTENPASARVLEKAGLHRESLLTAHVVHPNISSDPRDCFLYSRTRSGTRAV
jgi:RimJ/RimL family protein N-acetyltransferase